MRQEPLLNSIPNHKKRKSNTTKKSNHKHEYIWFKQHSENNGNYCSIDLIRGCKLKPTKWKIYKMCKHCGVEIFTSIWRPKDEFDEILKVAIEVKGRD